jgi:hypothetical protein
MSPSPLSPVHPRRVATGTAAEPDPIGPGTAGSIDIVAVIAFAALAVGLSTVMSLPFATGLLPTAVVGLVVPLAQLVPLLAALVVRSRSVPVRRALALSVPSWSATLLACVLALAVFTVVPVLKLAVGAATGLTSAALPEEPAALLFAIPMVLVMQTVFGLGDEAGWRGWLQDQLRPLGFWVSSFGIGLLWTAFHVPIVLALGLHGRELASYLLLILTVAPLLSALREAGGSVWPAVLGHGLLNSVRVAIDQNFATPMADRGDMAFWTVEVAGWALWLVVAWAVYRWTQRSATQGVGALDARGNVPAPIA